MSEDEIPQIGDEKLMAMIIELSYTIRKLADDVVGGSLDDDDKTIESFICRHSVILLKMLDREYSLEQANSEFVRLVEDIKIYARTRQLSHILSSLNWLDGPFPQGPDMGVFWENMRRRKEKNK